MHQILFCLTASLLYVNFDNGCASFSKCPHLLACLPISHLSCHDVTKLRSGYNESNQSQTITCVHIQLTNTGLQLVLSLNVIDSKYKQYQACIGSCINISMALIFLFVFNIHVFFMCYHVHTLVKCKYFWSHFYNKN